MTSPTVRCLACFLGAWIVSAGVVLSVPASAAPYTPVSETIEAYYGADLAVDTPAPIGLGDWNYEFIFDEQDRMGADASATGLEPSPTIAAADSSAHQRVAITVQACPLYSVMFVEPRFLRYCRLLN